jgi:hypothetical protein
MITSIDSPIERGQTKGNPNAISHFGIPLSAKQKRLLDKLPGYDNRVTVRKTEVNMTDLSALTAETGDEFSLFTKSNERLVVRGDNKSVNIDYITAKELSDKGYKWSGHTHPGNNKLVLLASDGDYEVLNAFLQIKSVIYNSSGDYLLFNKERV